MPPPTCRVAAGKTREDLTRRPNENETEREKEKEKRKKKAKNEKKIQRERSEGIEERKREREKEERNNRIPGLVRIRIANPSHVSGGPKSRILGLLRDPALIYDK